MLLIGAHGRWFGGNGEDGGASFLGLFGSVDNVQVDLEGDFVLPDFLFMNEFDPTEDADQLAFFEAQWQVPMALAGTLSNFHVVVSYPPGAAADFECIEADQTVTFTVRKQVADQLTVAADTAVTCTIAGEETSCSDIDPTHEVAFALGDRFTILYESSASALCDLEEEAGEGTLPVLPVATVGWTAQYDATPTP